MKNLASTATALVALPLLCAALIPNASAQTPWKVATGRLTTPWTRLVSPQNALPEYPRPQLKRARWQSLNGLWSYGLSDALATGAPAAMSGQILVPFPFESALSGIGKPSPIAQKLWYRRSFSVPAAWRGQRVMLHFGAVNYEATVKVNGQIVGAHRGGFDGFSFDITPQLRAGGNEIEVGVLNPLQTDVPDAQVVGKQRIAAGGIFYTGATGIWQSVWLEPVPAAHIQSLKITPDVDASQLRVRVNTGALNIDGRVPVVQITVLDGNRVVARAKGAANTELRLPLRQAKLWSPDAPFLYRVKATLGRGQNADAVDSYAAMRKISLGKDARGRQSLFLNNRNLLQVGPLDQGYWPDGIFTAPTDEALKFDIEMTKKLGFNMTRKHLKVEPARWYYHADKLGLLVWQDMPSMFGIGDRPNGGLSDAAKAQFDGEWREILAELHHFPSIVVWTTFNEGMGQHDTERVVAQTRALDPSRLVNNASGWVDKNVGDLHDSHIYPGPGSNAPEERRAAVNGEFGGITLDAGHRWINGADVMGYGSTLKSSWLATKRFQELMKAAYALQEARGTSAFVYTQLTDVEQEINGLLTYDRAVVKLDARIVAAANRGQFLPLPPNPNPSTDLVPTSEIEALSWRYSFEAPAANWFGRGFNDTGWKVGAAPFGRNIGNVGTPWSTSDIWIRREFALGAAIPAKLDLLLQHDEDAEIYLNGVLAATVTGYTGEYKRVPVSDAARAALQPGQNLIAVHVRQTIGGQGIDVGIAAAK